MTSAPVARICAMRTPSAPTPSEDTCVPASRATWATAPSVEPSVRMDAEAEEPVCLQTHVSVPQDLLVPAVRQEQCGFRPGRGTVDQLYSLSRVLEGAWEFAQPVHMCFVDLEKAFNRVPRGVLWGVLREYGVSGPLIRAVRSLYDRCQSLVRIAGSKSNSFPMMWSCCRHRPVTSNYHWIGSPPHVKRLG
ncbi:Protein kinase C-binding protein NELL1 NEL-like protein 1 [Takifugu flavidus]|uniref:Protein kinase C-binding protein NELL1 NEL-like protein 1 n=1 Tax=Takifugu flavidus TaxID=433684 RepID=A0A5C6NJC4_9TELE|nr:Protein kinase C-binding protein NELL1 NEL-like protein 1 [Takifugu flavidus]